VEELAEVTGAGFGRTIEAVRALAEEGLVAVSPTTPAGSPIGLVRLAD
jgi:hypothetical protein